MQIIQISKTDCPFCGIDGKVWEWVKMVEKELQRLEDSGVTIVNKHFFMDYLTTKDMEFKFKHTADGMFDLSSEPLKNCFCFRG